MVLTEYACQLESSPETGTNADLLPAEYGAGVAFDWHLQVQYAKVIASKDLATLAGRWASNRPDVIALRKGVGIDCRCIH